MRLSLCCIWRAARRCAGTGALVAALGLVASPARGDRRFYLFTYQYATLPKGASEIELSARREADASDPALTDGTLQIEAEYGLTDRFTASLYTVLAKEGGQPLDWDSEKVELKYRLGEPGRAPVDVLLYGEYEQPFSRRGWGEPELKVVLGRDWGVLNVSANLIERREIDDASGRREPWDSAWAAGGSWELSPRWNVGVEAHGSWTRSTGMAGPVVSYAGEKSWITIGPYWGLTRRDGHAGARAILGFEF